MENKFLIILMTIFACVKLIKSDTCTDKSPSDSTNCTTISMDKGFQCCMETQFFQAISTKLCKTFSDADATIRTTTVYNGYKYDCPGTKIVAPTPVSSSDQAMNNTMNNTSSLIKIETQPTTFTNVSSFLLSCESKNPKSKMDCTGFKYSGYLCCRTKYKLLVGDPDVSYCMYYTDNEAKNVVKMSSKYYEYECSGNFIQLFFFIVIFIYIWI